MATTRKWSSADTVVATSAADGDMLLLLTDPGGTPVSKKITRANFLAGISGGVEDHGALTGLLDDDHTQYLTKTPGSTARNTIAPGAAGIVPVTLNPTVSGTTSIEDALVVDGTISGTPGAGFGIRHRWRGKSSTTASQEMASREVSWSTATHASRKAKLEEYIYDTAARKWCEATANGTRALVRLYERVAIGTDPTDALLEIYDSAAMPEFRNNIGVNTNFGRFAFYEGASLGGYLQYIGTNFGTAARRGDFEIVAGGSGRVAIGSNTPTYFYTGGQAGVATDPAVTPQRKLAIGLAADSFMGIEFIANAASWMLDHRGSANSNAFWFSSPAGNTFEFFNNGDFKLTTTGKGIVIPSADGTLYRLTPANGGGSITITAV